MLFSSTIFLFFFLPVVLTLYFLLRRTDLRNVLLIISSLFFYAWGEWAYTLILIGSIALNYGFGLWLDGVREAAHRRWVLTAAVVLNLSILAYFKYAAFLIDNFVALVSPLEIVWDSALGSESIHLPIGISFFTFQALTYVVDVYRRDAPVQRNPLQVALYIALFPQLIAGPIIRYRGVAAQLIERRTSVADAALGIRRFVVGLGKKLLLADQLAIPADRIFALPPESLQPEVAWLGVTCFGLQVYFDFSGYSDMAIGLGRILGFHFPENFNTPYVSRSLQEFWRRWHISLSGWFRDYLYVPLNARRGSPGWQYLNLFVVFSLCGLWHGAHWNFVVWGLIHGAFVALERTGFGALRARLWPPIAQLYTLGVVWFAFVFFRAESLTHALGYVASMLGSTGAESEIFPMSLYLDREVFVILGLAIAFSSNWIKRVRMGVQQVLGHTGYQSLRLVALLLMFSASVMVMAAGTNHPFVYFRF